MNIGVTESISQIVPFANVFEFEIGSDFEVDILWHHKMIT